MSTLPASGMSVGDTAPSVAGTPESQGIGRSRIEPGGDTFARGQWWKNRSRPAGAEGASGGDWRERAAIRAYGAQQNTGLEGSGPPGEAIAASAGEKSAAQASSVGEEAGEGAADSDSSEGENSVAGDKGVTSSAGELTPEEHRIVTELQIRDRQVRSHEQAHLAAAGGYATSGASFQYQNGPDGKRYAVGGEVRIDVSRESDPEQTIRKMSVVRAAALAPADPSSQDRSVAASATAGIADAQRELQAMRTEEAEARRAEMTEQGGAENARSGAAVESEGDGEGLVAGGGGRGLLQYQANAVSVGGADGAADKKRPGVNLAV